MRELTDAVLGILERRFDGIFYQEYFDKGRSTKSFIKEVMYYLVMLRNLRLLYGLNIRVALVASNTMDYIACYIALILANVDFYLIPIKLRPILLDSIISGNDINVIFTDINFHENDKSLLNCKSLPFFKGIIDITTKRFTYLKSDKVMLVYEEINTQMYEALIAKRIHQISLRQFVYEEFKPRYREINVYSAGIDTIYAKAICFQDKDVANALGRVASSELLPELWNKKVCTAGLDYSYAPIWAILWPMESGGIFTHNQHDAEVIITSSKDFEKDWKFVTEDLYEMRFIGKLLQKNWLYWLFKFLAKRRLNVYFNSHTKKDAIIIVNAFMPPRIHDTIRNLPIYTTYGLQEMNQVVAVNDYSTYLQKKDNCVGKLIEGIGGETRDESLILSSTLVSDDYKLEKGTWFDTRDHAFFSEGLLYVFGKKRYQIDTPVTSYANRENLERIMKNIPYFEDILCFQDSEGKNHLLIYPNPRVIRTMYGMLDFVNLIKPYMKIVNDEYGDDFISSIKLVSTDFIRTHTGKIHKGLYFIASRRNKEELGF